MFSRKVASVPSVIITLAATLALTTLGSADELGDWYWQIMEQEDPFEENSYSCFVVNHDETLMAIGGPKSLTMIHWPFTLEEERRFIADLISIREQDYRSCERSAGEFDYCPQGSDVYETVTVEAIVNADKTRFREDAITDNSRANAFAFDIPTNSNDDVNVVFRVLFPPDIEEPDWQREVIRDEFTVQYPLIAVEKLTECNEREMQRRNAGD